jgi:hypothetical protein
LTPSTRDPKRNSLVAAAVFAPRPAFPLEIPQEMVSLIMYQTTHVWR